MLIRTLLALASASVVFAPINSAQTTRMVTNGQSIQAAIVASVDGDDVLVEPGSYGAIDFLGKKIAVRSKEGPLVTFITGGFAAVEFNQEGPESILDGFTLMAQRAIWGADPGLVTARQASPFIRNCIITGSTRIAVTGTPTMERCVIYSNRDGELNGGAINTGNTTQPVILRQCVLAANSANGGGGAVHGNVIADDCLFVGNSAVRETNTLTGAGGAVWGSIIATRCLFLRNTALAPFDGLGGAVYSTGAPSTFTNCTFTANRGRSGGAINGAATVLNSILRGNAGGEVVGAVTLSYTNIAGGAAGIGNIDALPDYVSFSRRDLNLNATSPCIDMGDPALFDADGSRSDMGAFPYQLMYPRQNTHQSDWPNPSWPNISTRHGGRSTLQLAAGPAAAGMSYLAMGSFSGTSPGIQFRGMTVPLNPDFYTSMALLSPNTPPLSGFIGVFDPSGRAAAQLDIQPGLDPALIGIVFHHAFGVFNGKTMLEVSNPLEMRLVP